VSRDALERLLMLGLVLPLVASLVRWAVAVVLYQNPAAAAALGITPPGLVALCWAAIGLLAVTAVRARPILRHDALARLLVLVLVLLMLIIMVVWAFVILHPI
jgi:hypothetical protein